MDATWLTDDQRLKLTQAEVDVLQALVNAGGCLRHVSANELLAVVDGRLRGQDD